MTTPALTLEDRVTALETRLDTVLPTLATKEDIARLEGKIEASNERLEGKMDAMFKHLDGKIDATGNRLLIRFTVVAVGVASLAIAAIRYL